jgi:hypothetical protein
VTSAWGGEAWQLPKRGLALKAWPRRGAAAAKQRLISTHERGKRDWRGEGLTCCLSCIGSPLQMQNASRDFQFVATHWGQSLKNSAHDQLPTELDICSPSLPIKLQESERVAEAMQGLKLTSEVRGGASSSKDSIGMCGVGHACPCGS